MSFEQTLFPSLLKGSDVGGIVPIFTFLDTHKPVHTQHTPVHTQVILCMWCDGLEIPSCIAQDENVPMTGPGTTGSYYYG